MAVKRSWIILFDLDNRLSISLISRFRSHSDSSSLILLLLFLFLPNTMFSLTLSISAILQSAGLGEGLTHMGCCSDSFHIVSAVLNCFPFHNLDKSQTLSTVMLLSIFTQESRYI